MQAQVLIKGQKRFYSIVLEKYIFFYFPEDRQEIGVMTCSCRLEVNPDSHDPPGEGL